MNVQLTATPADSLRKGIGLDADACHWFAFDVTTAESVTHTTARRVPGCPGLYRENLGREGSRFRIVITRNKTIKQEYFYFKTGQNESAVRKKAIRRWRKIRRSLPVITRSAFAQIERRKSRSGIVGVQRITDTVKKHPYDFWVAVWTDRRGQRRCHKFSVLKYGEDEAKKLAIKARRDGLRDMEK